MSLIQNTDVNVFITTPKDKKASDFIVDIQPSRLRIGLKGHDRLYIDEPTYSTVDKGESSWYLTAGMLHIILVKAHRGKNYYFLKLFTFYVDYFQSDISIIILFYICGCRRNMGSRNSQSL